MVYIKSLNGKKKKKPKSSDGSSHENLVSFPRTDTPEAPIISGMREATEGQLISINCSVNYYCPTRPPTLHLIWERGDQQNITMPVEIQTVFAEPNKPTLLASLSFTVSHQVKPRLRCEASYPGASPLTTAKELHVTCEQIWVCFCYLTGFTCLIHQIFIILICFSVSPKDVVVQVQSLTVKEGGSALLVCTCKADPPAFDYHWSYSQQGRTVYLHHRTHMVRVFNVTRDMRVRCSAQNLIGQGESQPTPLNIKCKVRFFLGLLYTILLFGEWSYDGFYILNSKT